jgi:hypothetical protein
MKNTWETPDINELNISSSQDGTITTDSEATTSTGS